MGDWHFCSLILSLGFHVLFPTRPCYILTFDLISRLWNKRRNYVQATPRTRHRHHRCWNAWIVINALAQVAAVTEHHFIPIIAWTVEIPSGCVSLSPAHFPSLWVQGLWDGCDKLPEPGSCHCVSLFSSGHSLLQPHPGRMIWWVLSRCLCLFWVTFFPKWPDRFIGLLEKGKIKIRGAG